MDANLTQIENDPNGCWERMTPLQLQYFEDKYYARIEKELQRQQRTLRLEESNRLKLEKKEQKYLTKVVTIYQRIHQLHTYGLTEEMFRYHGRSVGNDIHDLPVIWTGWESEESISRRGTGYTHCSEHFWPRQYAGEQIIRYVIENKGIPLAVLKEMLETFRQVHRVTPEENRKLMPYQSVYNFTTPEEAYKQAGIVLVQVNK